MVRKIVEFEGLTLGTRYKLGQKLPPERGVKMAVLQFPARRSIDGNAESTDKIAAGGSGKELTLHNALLEFSFGIACTRIEVRVHTGSEANVIEINDASVAFKTPAELDRRSIGGTALLVAGSGNTGQIEIQSETGKPIENFALGGSELSIDDVVFDD